LIPPSGFENTLYPLRHRLVHSYGLSMKDEDNNTAITTLVRHTNDIITTGAGVPKMIVVNPRNTAYVSDAGPAVCNMSILDKLSLSLKFNMTDNCSDRQETAAGVFTGDTIHSLKFFWRPIFFSFSEKLAAADDDTGTTVEAILGLTSDATFEDVVPLTTNKLPTTGASNIAHPASTVNIAEVFGDYNMTTNLNGEDQPWDEDLFQDALKRFTNKGALKSMVGRTRHVTLTRSKPYMNFFIDKFVPKSIRRVQPFTFFAIQVHVPIVSHVSSPYHATTLTGSVAHLGVKLICHYHEWNNGHYQQPEGLPPTSA